MERYSTRTLDELGMLTIPTDIRNNMGWVAESRIAVYHTDALLILKAAGGNQPFVVFD